MLELSSEQRLTVISLLNENSFSLTEIQKKIGASTSEIHRNLQRLLESQIIIKNIDGKYTLSTFGKAINSQLSFWEFFTSNKKYFQTHTLDGLDSIFVQSIGALSGSCLVEGFVKVQETWKNIYKNSTVYIHNMLHEISYDSDTMDVLAKKLGQKISLHTIFAKDTIVSQNRESIIKSSGFESILKQDTIKRRLIDSIPVSIVMNETEAAISFAGINGKIDVSHAFYGKSLEFHRLCHDIFSRYWEISGVFSESKIKK